MQAGRHGDKLRSMRWVVLFSLILGASHCSPIGWSDCLHTGPPPAAAVQRAWRRLALATHPDKADDQTDSFVHQTAAKTFLKDAMRYRLHKLLGADGPMRPFNQQTAEWGHVQVGGPMRSGWPYLQMQAEIRMQQPLSVGAHWEVSFGAKNGTSIHYKGDEQEGGYCVCCQLRHNSSCLLLPAEQQAAGALGAYETHDCPLGKRFNLSVTRPLHIDQPGQWASVLVIRDSSAKEIACLSAVFQVAPATVAVTNQPGVNNFIDPAIPKRNATEDSCASNSSSNQLHSEKIKPSQPLVKFELHAAGSICTDGGDILEGPLDDWTDCEDHPQVGRLCRMTHKCRDKCLKRPRCQFYSSFRNGWCQLSSRCGSVAASSNGQVTTFKKTETAQH